MTGRTEPARRIRIALSDAAYAIALDRGGVAQHGLRAALAEARAVAPQDGPRREFSCTDQDSRRLLRFYKSAASFFSVSKDEERGLICREAYAAIDLARRQAGFEALRW